MICTCKEWTENITDLDACILLARIHGFQTDGTPFEYCPWCGKSLVPAETIKGLCDE